MADTCTFCGQDLAPYDTVAVYETVEGEETPAGRFCNYGCLSAHIDRADLVEGACCHVEFD